MMRMSYSNSSAAIPQTLEEPPTTPDPATTLAQLFNPNSTNSPKPMVPRPTRTRIKRPVLTRTVKA